MEDEGGGEEGMGVELAPEQKSSFADILAMKGGSTFRSWCDSEHKLRPQGGHASSLGPGRAEAPATHARNRTKSGRPLPHEPPHKLTREHPDVLRRRASLCAPVTRGVRGDVPALASALAPASVPCGW